MEFAQHAQKSNEIIGLADGHCFYVSCHRLFEPRLQGRPVCVLSNGDTSVVARSDEAKALGVKMSQPRWELDDLVRRQGLILKSSNHDLYADVHRRFMLSLRSLVVQISPYSVDESWLLLSGMRGDLGEIGHRIRQHVLKTVGIPIGVGISHNFTTAKLANWASKKWKRQTGSVVAITDYERMRKLMAVADVSEVWGIGRRLTDHLKSHGITTALQLSEADPRRMRKLHGIGLARTIRELNWELCIGPDDDGSPQKSMSCTRTFPGPIDSFGEIAKYLTTFSSLIGGKLRVQRLMATTVRVFLMPCRSSTVTVQGKSATIALIIPTSDTRVLISAALEALKLCFTDHGSWIRAGVVILETVTESNYTPDLFAPEPTPRSKELMLALDRINRKSGNGTVRFGSEHQNLGQLSRCQYPTKRSTTSWTELPEAK